MQPPADHDLELALSDFMQMKRDRALPPQMEIKLGYLQAKILSSYYDEELCKQLPYFEKCSLEQMNRETQVGLFKSIMQCLSGRVSIDYFIDQVVHVRRMEMLAMWTKYYLNCDAKRLALCKLNNRNESSLVFEFGRFRLSKKCLTYKNRIGFGVIHNKTPYFFGFDEETACERVHRTLLQLSKQFKEKQQKNNDGRSTAKQCLREKEVDQKIGIQDRQSVNLQLHGQQYEESMLTLDIQETEFLRATQKHIDDSQLSSDVNYKLHQNLQFGRILLHSFKPKMKIFLLLQGIRIEEVVESYIRMPEWNPEVHQFRVLHRIGNCSYKAYLQTKKYSMISLCREAVVTFSSFRTCKCIKEQASDAVDKIYLLLSSVKEEGDTGYGCTKMSIHQIVELAQQRDSQTVLMTILTEVDFKGYASQADNVQMMLSLFRPISSFHRFCKQRQIMSDSGHRLFLLDTCKCQNSKGNVFRGFSLNRRKSSMTIDESDLPLIVSTIQQKQSQQLQPKQQKYLNNESLSEHRRVSEQFMTLITQYHNHVQNQAFVAQIHNKTMQRYYLFKRFPTNPNNQTQEHREAMDFLLQAGRWKLQNGEYIFCDQAIIDAQKDIIKYIIKQIGANLFSGKSIMNMSLPVQIFAKKSTLELMADTFGFFPKFMKLAVESVLRICCVRQSLLARGAMPVDSELDVKLDHAACFRQSSELLFVDDVGEFVHVHGAGRGRRTARRG